ncbi:MAG: citrate synthase, partial [Xanthobacteraceae bacterium]
AATGRLPSADPVHRQLATAWGTDAAGAELIRTALVLLADHELNASTFAVRVVASTGASLASALSAGLGALSGPLHGGQTSLVEALFEEAERGGDAAGLVEKRLWRGDRLPGFGHPLYPDGDPRAAALLRRGAEPLCRRTIRRLDRACAGTARRGKPDPAARPLRGPRGIACLSDRRRRDHPSLWPESCPCRPNSPGCGARPRPARSSAGDGGHAADSRG